jgi:hypothetical protein
LPQAPFTVTDGPVSHRQIERESGCTHHFSPRKYAFRQRLSGFGVWHSMSSKPDAIRALAESERNRIGQRPGNSPAAGR